MHHITQEILRATINAVTIVAGIATITMAFVAAFAYRVGKRQLDALALTNKLAAFHYYEDKFESQNFLEKRRLAAGALFDSLESTEKKHQSTIADADDVLDFFETVGFLVRRGVLDEEMVWNTWNYWATRYWIAADDYVKIRQSEDPTEYEDFGHLYRRLIDFDAVRQHETNERVTPNFEEVKRFLKEESQYV